MKEASGELSMTAIAVVAIAAVGGIFMTFVWPQLKGTMGAQAKCQSAFSCSVCTDGKMTCNSYYDENGNTKNGPLTCSC